MVMRLYVTVFLAVLALSGQTLFLTKTDFGGAAWAQDDGDGGPGNDRVYNDHDNDGDADGWWDSFGGRPGGEETPPGPTAPPIVSFVPVPTPTPTPPRPTRTPPPVIVPVVDLPEFRPEEIVTANIGDADLQILVDQGFTVIETVDIPIFSIIVRRLGTPGGVGIADALAVVRGLATGQQSDLNHFYRIVQQAGRPSCEGVQCAERSQVGWPSFEARDPSCGGGIQIGMIDSGINDKHDTFSGARMELLRLSPVSDGGPSLNVHGTSVAALLVGDPASRSPGLIPGATLVAVDSFETVGDDTRTDVVALIKGLAFLAEEQVKIINLSLAGPDNTLLAGVVGELTLVMDTVVVAAVGNNGPDAEPAYPAAYDPVIAVTGVDRTGAIYEQAVRGGHVDLSAPGVEVWTAASVKGARWKTGTSFAAPFVSAAAAILRQSNPELNVSDVVAGLQEGAKDLGDPGRDPVFGVGLLNLGALCD